MIEPILTVDEEHAKMIHFGYALSNDSCPECIDGILYKHANGTLICNCQQCNYFKTYHGV